jgi:hypothetical protein
VCDWTYINPSSQFCMAADYPSQRIRFFFFSSLFRPAAGIDRAYLSFFVLYRLCAVSLYFDIVLDGPFSHGDLTRHAPLTSAPFDTSTVAGRSSQQGSFSSSSFCCCWSIVNVQTWQKNRATGGGRVGGLPHSHLKLFGFRAVVVDVCHHI